MSDHGLLFQGASTMILDICFRVEFNRGQIKHTINANSTEISCEHNYQEREQVIVV
jgi:hypothetical protein